VADYLRIARAVLAERTTAPAAPVRGATHGETGDPWKGIPWADWKAAMLNRLFQKQGVIGEPARITVATVQHGERKTGNL